MSAPGARRRDAARRAGGQWPFRQAISESPASGLVSTSETAAQIARKFTDALGADKDDAAGALMRARPPTSSRRSTSCSSAACTRWTVRSPSDPPTGRRPAGGSDRGDEDRPGTPGSADRRNQRRRGQAVHPVHETVADHRARYRTAAGLRRARDPGPDHRRLPGLPAPEACVQLGGDFAFRDRRLADRRAHGTHAPPTSTATTTRRARCTGPGSGPPTPWNCSRCSTSTELASAVRSPPGSTARRR